MSATRASWPTGMDTIVGKLSTNEQNYNEMPGIAGIATLPKYSTMATATTCAIATQTATEAIKTSMGATTQHCKTAIVTAWLWAKRICGRVRRTARKKMTNTRTRTEDITEVTVTRTCIRMSIARHSNAVTRMDTGPGDKLPAYISIHGFGCAGATRLSSERHVRAYYTE